MMPGLFDEQVLLKKLDQKVAPLARANSIVDWRRFLPIIEKAPGRDNASAGKDMNAWLQSLAGKAA